MNHDEGYNPDIIRAELVEEMEPGAPWQWREVRPVPPPRQRRVWTPAILFVATCLSTLFSGMLTASSEAGWFAAFVHGLWYAVPLMIILVCHEMGHFLQARRYGVPASFPYFLPLPGSPFGTLGAFIVMGPRMGHRKALFDIGITGPLAGLVPTIIFLVVGLHYSGYDVRPRHGMLYGDPLLFKFLAKWILHLPAGYEVIAHPMAFAGWVGLLITSLNLMPIGQLDGGHVLYALLRQKANRIATLLLYSAVVVVALDFKQLYVWMLMLILLIVMGPVHPPTADDSEPLGAVRTVLGWLTLAFIIIGFTPTPLQVLP